MTNGKRPGLGPHRRSDQFHVVYLLVDRAKEKVSRLFDRKKQSGQQPDQQRVRLKDNYAVSGFYLELTDPKTGEQRFESLWDEVAPDFLSGTTNKTRFYTGDLYYKNLFQHFEKNLSTSELLVVIGYGFQDPGINEYLEKNFLSREKQMVVIDPYKPKTDLLEKYNATHIPKGVTQVTYQEYVEQIPTELKPKAE